MDKQVEAQKRSVFVLGGARSGKSAYALALGSELPGPKTFVATAEAFDSEMAARIAAHKAERGPEWAVVEEPTAIAAEIRKASASAVLLIDCLTLWLSNLLGTGMDDRAVLDAVGELKVAVAESSSNVLMVSNDVGSGIIPENALARRFCDLSGEMNKRMAEAAGEVYLLTAGIPLKLK